MYRELTGLECRDGPPPDGARLLRLDLRKIADKWLDGLRFPAAREEVINRARANHAPAPVLDALHDLDKPSYPNKGVLLHHLCRRGRGRD